MDTTEPCPILGKVRLVVAINCVWVHSRPLVARRGAFSICTRAALMTESMNRLASILPSTQVLVGVDATSKKRAFEEAGLLFEGLHGLSRALITDSLFARERLGSTGLGHGVAIPHGRIKGLKAPMAAVFQLVRPIGFPLKQYQDDVHDVESGVITIQPKHTSWNDEALELIHFMD